MNPHLTVANVKLLNMAFEALRALASPSFLKPHTTLLKLPEFNHLPIHLMHILLSGPLYMILPLLGEPSISSWNQELTETSPGKHFCLGLPCAAHEVTASQHRERTSLWICLPHCKVRCLFVVASVCSKPTIILSPTQVSLELCVMTETKGL